LEPLPLRMGVRRIGIRWRMGIWAQKPGWSLAFRATVLWMGIWAQKPGWSLAFRATALWMGIRAWMPGCSLAAVGCESLALPGAPLCG